MRNVLICCYLGDMLLCCEQKDSSPDEVLDLHESAQVLSALLHLLHYPLSPPVEAEVPPLKGDSGSAKFDRERLLPRIPSYEHTSVIPLPVLQPMLFDLVDKYGLNVDIFSVLCAHLLAHAPAHPLRVYGFAASFEPRYHWRRSPTGPAAGEDTQNPASDKFGIGAEKEMEEQMQKIASKAIQFLEPIGSYSMENVLDAIPSVKALHRVVQLQHLRLRALRVVLDESEIFPKGELFAVNPNITPLFPFLGDLCWASPRGALNLCHVSPFPFFPIQ